VATGRTTHRFLKATAWWSSLGDRSPLQLVARRCDSSPGHPDERRHKRNARSATFATAIESQSAPASIGDTSDSECRSHRQPGRPAEDSDAGSRIGTLARRSGRTSREKRVPARDPRRGLSHSRRVRGEWDDACEGRIEGYLAGAATAAACRAAASGRQLQVRPAWRRVEVADKAGLCLGRRGPVLGEAGMIVRHLCGVGGVRGSDARHTRIGEVRY
jgi:hypothetical protein